MGAVDDACSVQETWPVNVIAGVRAAFEFAAADPAAARLLIIETAAGPDGIEFHRRMIDDLAERLRDAAGPQESSSDAQEQSLILGVLGIVTIRLTLDQAKTLPTVTLEAAEFLFAPYLVDEPARQLIAGAIEHSLSGRS